MENALTPAQNSLTPAQNGWLKLAEIKSTLFTELQNAELAVQSKLSDLPNDLGPVQEAIKEAKTITADAKGKRLAFTRLIDEKLLTPSMEYEKRMEGLIKLANEKELELRKAEAAAASQAAAYNSEVAAYKAHIVNEWFRIAAEYRNAISRQINTTYTYCLENRVEVEHIPAYIEKLIGIINDTKLPNPNTFKRTLISNEAAREIIKEIRPYDPTVDRERFIKEAASIFDSYELDLANAQAAIEAIQLEEIEKEVETQKLLAAEMATNVLIAQSEVATVEGPKVKRELKIVEENTEAWAKAVVANFMKNWQYCNKYVRVKSWSKLTLAQMADALTKHISETGEQLSGLTTTEIEK